MKALEKITNVLGNVLTGLKRARVSRHLSYLEYLESGVNLTEKTMQKKCKEAIKGMRWDERSLSEEHKEALEKIAEVVQSNAKSGDILSSILVNELKGSLKSANEIREFMESMSGYLEIPLWREKERGFNLLKFRYPGSSGTLARELERRVIELEVKEFERSSDEGVATRGEAVMEKKRRRL